MRCVALRVLGAVRNHGSGHVGVAWLGEALLSPRDPRPTPVRRQGPSPLAPGQKASGGVSRPRWGPGRGHRGEVASWRGRGSWRDAGGGRSGWVKRRTVGLGVAPPAGAAMSSRGGSTRGARGTERCPRDLMLGLVRTRQFAGRHRHVPPGWGVTGGDGGAWGKVLDGWEDTLWLGGETGGFV
jgi:hypothetical protein